MPRYSVMRVALLASVCLLMLPPVAVARDQGAGAARGMQVYAAQKCSICHAIGGQGNKKLPLDGVGAKLSVEQIREWIVDPSAAAKKATSTAKPAMKAYPNLPKDDLDALVAYMKSLDKK